MSKLGVHSMLTVTSYAIDRFDAGFGCIVAVQLWSCVATPNRFTYANALMLPAMPLS